MKTTWPIVKSLLKDFSLMSSLENNYKTKDDRFLNGLKLLLNKLPSIARQKFIEESTSSFGNVHSPSKGIANAVEKEITSTQMDDEDPFMVDFKWLLVLIYDHPFAKCNTLIQLFCPVKLNFNGIGIRSGYSSRGKLQHTQVQKQSKTKNAPVPRFLLNLACKSAGSFTWNSET